jgi:glycine cleavage system transcriptional repressor
VSHFAVAAIGSDRPGIVAALTEALLDLEGNVEDSRMTILRGHFSVMLIVSVPEASDREALRRRLGEVRERLGLEALTVSEVDELGPSSPSPSHVITVYGADHPGIVHAISAELADRAVNITDLQTKLAGDPGSPLYVMMLEVELAGADAGELERALAGVAETASVEVSIGELGAEAL